MNTIHHIYLRPGRGPGTSIARMAAKFSIAVQSTSSCCCSCCC